MLARLKAIPNNNMARLFPPVLDPYIPIKAPIDPATGRNLAEMPNNFFPGAVWGVYCSLKRKSDNLELIIGRVQANT